MSSRCQSCHCTASTRWQVNYTHPQVDLIRGCVTNTHQRMGRPTPRLTTPTASRCCLQSPVVLLSLPGLTTSSWCSCSGEWLTRTGHSLCPHHLPSPYHLPDLLFWDLFYCPFKFLCIFLLIVFLFWQLCCVGPFFFSFLLIEFSLFLLTIDGLVCFPQLTTEGRTANPFGCSVFEILLYITTSFSVLSSFDGAESFI